MIRVRPPLKNSFKEMETIDNIDISEDEKIIKISEV